MPNSTWTRITISLAAAIWFIAAWMLGLAPDSSWFRPLGIASSAVVLILLLFDALLWRLLPYWAVRKPNLRGIWKANLTSSYLNSEGKNVDFGCFLVVRQTYSSIHIEMLFPKSESTSRSANLVSVDGSHELWYSYESTAHSLDREDNPPHRGAAKLRISDGRNTKIAGDYWTDRKTKGRLNATKHAKQIITDYEEAMKAFD
jgi:hypothetical protein